MSSGTKVASSTSRQKSVKVADSEAAADQSGDFDIYKFLNDENTATLRDPILQQMTVVRYEGEVDSATGFFHGQGKMVSTLGYVYSGQFQRGLMHGQGRIEWNDGTSYEGNFVDNAISGKGKYQWANGDWYEGEVFQYVRHGQGTFFYKALNEKYEGGWVSGKRHGKGKLSYSADGATRYEGDWQDDRRTGKGVMHYGAGGVYDGDWQSDVRHGQGTMTWRKDGQVVQIYQGDWMNGTPCGQGVSTYIRPPQPGSPPPETGSQYRDIALNTYTGEFYNGQRHGFGTFVYDDGSRYEGQWVNNLKHGDGKYTSANGVIYVGQFVEGNPATPISDVKPETTVACPLPLYIKDVLAQTETNEAEAMIAVQSVVSRNNGLLRGVFQYYCALDSGVEVVTTPKEWNKKRSQGTMYLVQFFRLLNDAKLINKHVTIAAISRALLAFKDRNETTSVNAYLASDPQADAEPSFSAPTKLKEAKSKENSESVNEKSADTDAGEAKGTRKQRPSATSTFSSGSGNRGSPLRFTSQTYHAPWERYRYEIYQFLGELNFREFVEALIRVVAIMYKEPEFGSLAHKFQLVIDEHLTFTRQPTGGNPLCKTSREFKGAIVPYLSTLKKIYNYFATMTVLGSTKTPNVPTPKPGSRQAALETPTMRVRQLCLLLKDFGVLSHFKDLKLPFLLKSLPYDRYPQFSTSLYRKQFLMYAVPPQHAITRSTPPQTGGSSGLTGLRGPPSATPSNLTVPSQQTSPAAGVQPMNFGQTLSAQSAALTMSGSSDAGPDPRELLEEAERAFTSKMALMHKSKGHGNKNFFQTLQMDLELTFVEFVEALVNIVSQLPTEGSMPHRISQFMTTFIEPRVKKIPV